MQLEELGRMAGRTGNLRPLQKRNRYTGSSTDIWIHSFGCHMSCCCTDQPRWTLNWSKLKAVVKEVLIKILKAVNHRNHWRHVESCQSLQLPMKSHSRSGKVMSRSTISSTSDLLMKCRQSNVLLCACFILIIVVVYIYLLRNSCLTPTKVSGFFRTPTCLIIRFSREFPMTKCLRIERQSCV